MELIKELQTEPNNEKIVGSFFVQFQAGAHKLHEQARKTVKKNSEKKRGKRHDIRHLLHHLQTSSASKDSNCNRKFKHYNQSVSFFSNSTISSTPQITFYLLIKKRERHL